MLNKTLQRVGAGDETSWSGSWSTPVVGWTNSHVRNSLSSSDHNAISRRKSWCLLTLCRCSPVLQHAIQVAHQKLDIDASLPERTSLSMSNITDLMSLILDATFLSFRGKMHQQVHGSAMESPVVVATC